MKFPKDINISDFDYNLPGEFIAQYPLKIRNRSKLLIYNKGTITDETFSNIYKYLPAGSLIVLNNSKVINARLYFRNKTGAKIEIFCLEPENPPDFHLSLTETRNCQWRCYIGNRRKLKQKNLTSDFFADGIRISLKAELIATEADSHIVEFSWNNNITFGKILAYFGNIPIPPYISRKPLEEDLTTYQTIYSRIDGSVASPTAGLHFTETEFKQLAENGVESVFVTLHIGAGTFKPVQSENISEHLMHREHFVVNLELIQKLMKYYPQITAVGTTTARTLESLYYIGAEISENKFNNGYIHVNQWDAYSHNINIEPFFALKVIENHMLSHCISELHATTSLMIVPGFKFKYISALITNFHLPESTLLLLVSGFTGGRWKEIYNHALKNKYRFLSYGDASLLFKQ